MWWLDLQLRKQNHNCYFISTTAISLAQLQKFYVGIIQTYGKTANAMSQLQIKCHNCNLNGITAKTKLPKVCHVSSSHQKRPAAGPAPPPAIALLADALIHSKTCCESPAMVYNNHPLLKNSNLACFLTPKPAAPPCHCVADDALHAIH